MKDNYQQIISITEQILNIFDDTNKNLSKEDIERTYKLLDDLYKKEAEGAEMLNEQNGEFKDLISAIDEKIAALEAENK